MLARMEKAGLLDDDNFSNVMVDLNDAMKVDGGRSDWQLARMNPKVHEMLARPDLAPKAEEPPKRKRGAEKERAVTKFPEPDGP